MNPQWVGDSFDIVKRFFVERLNEIGYHVVVDPMLTGEWMGLEHSFYTLLKAQPLSEEIQGKSALKIKEKLNLLNETGNYGFYYDSHARFLFASSSTEKLQKIEKQLLHSGLPERRLIR